MFNKISIIIFALFMLSFAINKTNNIFFQPIHFPNPIYNFNKTPLDSATIELGRTLFYDPILSANNSISCASCHSPYNAFAHTDHDLSHGIFDSIGNRNAPALFNLAWQKHFMWDGAINHLDMQALAPISNNKEMGSSINQVIEKLHNSVEYKKLFYHTFKDSSINSFKILKALSQFQLTLISANAKYDKVILGKEKFTTQEQNGYIIFKNNCNTCHSEPLFTNNNFEINQLPIDSTLHDLGRFKITQLDTDKMKFKVPSLRNLSYTYPYMHDGRFKTLKQVLNHYSDKTLIINHSNKLIQLNSNEKVDLISFLLTLNDQEFVFNKKHQFKNFSK